MDSHSLEACETRWHWIGQRTLIAMAQRARAASGVTGQARRRSYSDEDAAVCVEAAFILGSASRGQRAAGLPTASQSTFNRRGLTMPSISDEERGVVSVLGRRAKAGDVAALAEVERRHDFDRAVGAVLRAALALVPVQPATGRYRLPPADARLAEALRDHDPTAVALAFPELAAVEPGEPKPAPPAIVTVPQPIPETCPMPRRRRMPTDDAICAAFRKGQSAARMSSDWGVSVQAVYAHWRRLGLSRRAAPVAVVPLAPRLEPAQRLAAPVSPDGHLSVVDLGRAVTLARREGITPAEAVAFIRADVDQARAFVCEPPGAGFPVPRMSPRLAAWFDALVDGDPLPDLQMEDIHNV
ncbi:hypothetical protein ACE100_30320 [Methylobacterium sp. MA0201]